MTKTITNNLQIFINWCPPVFPFPYRAQRMWNVFWLKKSWGENCTESCLRFNFFQILFIVFLCAHGVLLILLYKTTLYSFHIISRCFSKCQNVFCPKKHNYAWKAIASDSDKTNGIIPIMFSLSILKNLVRYLNKQTNRQVYIMHLWT